MVYGIADTLAVSLLSEYLSLHVPILVAPNVNPALAWHPHYQQSLARLQEWGVSVLHDPSAPFPTWMIPWKQIMKELGGPARTDGD
jgi:phosphopantothenoylcysteine synthetase/decarboxylase